MNSRKTTFAACAALAIVVTASIAMAQEAPSEPIAAEATGGPVAASEAPTPPGTAPDGKIAPAASGGSSEAPGEAPEDPELSGIAAKLYEAVLSKEWKMAAVLLVLLLGLAIRKAATRVEFLKWFTTRWGGWTLNFTITGAGALITTLAAGMPIDSTVLLSALTVAFAAAGGIEFFKDAFGKKAEA